MTREEAIAIAERERDHHEVAPEAVVINADRRYIELLVRESRPKILLRDALVWVVRFQSGVAWRDLAVEEATGKIVRVEYSRTEATLRLEQSPGTAGEALDGFLA